MGKTKCNLKTQSFGIWCHADW